MKDLACGVVEFYLSEQLISEKALSDCAPEVAETSSCDAIEIVDVKEMLTKVLENFETICSGRGKLSGQRQLACFYSLLLFSVIKSLLIDAHSLRAIYESTAAWRDTDAIKIASSYKAVVSVYSWASKSDQILDNNEENGDVGLRTALENTREFLCTRAWAESGIKGSKDFLSSLGSCLLSDSIFNGLFLQRFGLGKLEQNASSLSSSKENAPWSSDLGKSNSITTFQKDILIFGESVSTSVPTSPKSETIWEHTIALDNNFVQPTEERDNTRRRHSGKRTGALAPEVAKKARRIRKLRACWSCWISKMPVSLI